MIAVLDYGIGNLRSAEKALQHLGADAALTDDAAAVDRADAVVLPGVGAFGACMAALRRSGLEGPARAAVSDGRPFLGICVGMQMLFEGSDENPEVAGLGLLEGRVRRLPEGEKHPQMQWNRLDRLGSAQGGTHPMFAGLAAPVWVYFVHSFAAVPPGGPASPDVVATCDYGGPVVAAVARDHLWATQFHPEKSGRTGLALLANFVKAAGGPVPGD